MFDFNEQCDKCKAYHLGNQWMGWTCKHCQHFQSYNKHVPKEFICIYTKAYIRSHCVGCDYMINGDE